MFKNLSDLNFAIFISSYIGYCLTGKQDLLDQSVKTICKQVKRLIEQKKIKCYDIDKGQERIIDVMKAEVKLESGMLVVELFGKFESFDIWTTANIGDIEIISANSKDIKV